MSDLWTRGWTRCDCDDGLRREEAPSISNRNAPRLVSRPCSDCGGFGVVRENVQAPPAASVEAPADFLKIARIQPPEGRKVFAFFDTPCPSAALLGDGFAVTLATVSAERLAARVLLQKVADMTGDLDRTVNGAP